MAGLLLWNNKPLRAILIALSASLLLSNLALPEDGEPRSPKLLLNPQRLKRLERDRERQTVRWVNFENRVRLAPDSPERGFELALYYAITHDEKRGREAVEWALAHKCDQRQAALVLDWCAALLSAEEKGKLSAGPCLMVVTGRMPPTSERARNSLFTAIAHGEGADATSPEWKQVLKELQDGKFTEPDTLYPACEYIGAVRSTQHTDLRQDDTHFFSELPVELLLSLKPEKIQHPDWMTHVAALALVALDPNLEGSQFLQGWAVEDAHMLRDGPGVAYELLWADPYLPGVGFQNLDPWVYDERGRLFARNGWTSDACWIAVTTRGVEQENCPAQWEKVATHFGHLTLMPAGEHCLEVPHRTNPRDVVVLWRMQEHQSLTYLSEKRKFTVPADESGMWRVPENVEGRVCTHP